MVLTVRVRTHFFVVLFASGISTAVIVLAVLLSALLVGNVVQYFKRPKKLPDVRTSILAVHGPDTDAELGRVQQ